MNRTQAKEYYAARHYQLYGDNEQRHELVDDYYWLTCTQCSFAVCLTNEDDCDDDDCDDDE